MSPLLDVAIVLGVHLAGAKTTNNLGRIRLTRTSAARAVRVRSIVHKHVL